MALLYLPVNRLDAFTCEEGVCLAEVLAAEEPAVCRKWAGVRGCEDEVPAVWGNQGLFLDGETAPEHKHEIFADLREPLDNGVGELLPTDAGVACRHVGAHGERCVQKQDSLLGPTFKVAVRRRVDAEIVVNFLENVDERGRGIDSVRHGEAETMCLAWVVVRVLAEDDHFHLVDGAKIKRCENLGAGRVDDVVIRFFLQEDFLYFFEVRLLELVGKQAKPGLFKFDGHGE